MTYTVISSIPEVGMISIFSTHSNEPDTSIWIGSSKHVPIAKLERLCGWFNESNIAAVSAITVLPSSAREYVKIS